MLKVPAVCKCMYSHHMKQSIRSTGHQSCSSWSQLNREKIIFPCPRSRLRIWSRETGSAVPSRVALLLLHTQAESGFYSRDSSRFSRRRLFIHTRSRFPHRLFFLNRKSLEKKLEIIFLFRPTLSRHLAGEKHGNREFSKTIHRCGF